MFGLARWGLHHGLDIKVNWLGRAGVWPVFMRRCSSRMAGLETVGAVCLYIGLVLVLGSAAQYFRDGLAARRAQPSTELDTLRLGAMDTFPDLGSLSDQELKDLIQQLTDEEQEVSYRRRILHGKIDILRAELVNRLRKKHEGGEDVISGADVQRLTDILAGRASGSDDDVACSGRRVARHCPECGFVVTEGANYCPRCGAFLGSREPTRDDATTATYVIDEATGELRPVDVGDVAAESGALVIRSGGGRVGQSFPLHGERMTIGRSPDAEIFLDDVTVSRDHAVLVHRSGRVVPGRLRLAQRHLRQPPADRLAPARGRRRAAGRQVQAHLPRALSGRDDASRRPSRSTTTLRRCRCAAERRGAAQVADDRRRLQGARRRSSRTSRSRRSATSRIRSCWRRGARPAATGSTRRPTSRACARSCACSATSSCRCG